MQARSTSFPQTTSQGGDSKPRPHVLLNTCEDTESTGIVAYCSTQVTEAQFDAVHHLVNPARAGSRGTGFRKATNVYVSRLVAIEAEDLTQMEGRVIDDMVQIRSALAQALGLSTDTGTGPGFARGSMRGQVVVLETGFAEAVSTEYAVIMTEPQYCREHRYQVIVPLYPEAEFEAFPHDVVVETAWVERLPSYHAVVLAVESVQSVFEPTQVTRHTGVVVDDQTIQQLEAAFKRHFDL